MRVGHAHAPANGHFHSTEQPRRDVIVIAYSSKLYLRHSFPDLRCMPRRLTKKLDSTVWNPKAVSVAPGTTSRIVWA